MTEKEKDVLDALNAVRRAYWQLPAGPSCEHKDFESGLRALENVILARVGARASDAALFGGR